MGHGEGPDYFEMDATQERLRLVMDQALRKTNIAKAHSHPYIPRVFFIDEAHRAGAKTQETMLKDIEDHQEAIFILSTTQPDKLDTAIAAVTAFGIAERTAPLGPRQSRAEIGALLKTSGLEQQMKTAGLWPLWESGERGRLP